MGRGGYCVCHRSGTALSGRERCVPWKAAPEAWAVPDAEDNISDPGAAPETLKFDTALVEEPLQFDSRGPKKPVGEFLKRLVEISVEYADQKVSRTSPRTPVTDFLKLFGFGLRYPSSEGGAYVPFCAAGLSFAACRAYCDLNPKNTYDSKDPVPDLKPILTDINKHYFKSSPAVRYIKQDAEKRGKWVDPEGVTPVAGWPVVFSWEKDGTPNHIGLVVRLEGKTLHTVDYNTSPQNDSNGGTVARRERDIDFVLGYVKID